MPRWPQDNSCSTGGGERAVREGRLLSPASRCQGEGGLGKGPRNPPTGMPGRQPQGLGLSSWSRGKDTQPASTFSRLGLCLGCHRAQPPICAQTPNPIVHLIYAHSQLHPCPGGTYHPCRGMLVWDLIPKCTPTEGKQGPQNQPPLGWGWGLQASNKGCRLSVRDPWEAGPPMELGETLAQPQGWCTDPLPSFPVWLKG